MLPDPSLANNTASVPFLQAAPSQVLTELLGWAKTLPSWQQEAMRRLFRKDTLSLEDVEELHKLAAIEHNLSEGRMPSTVLTETDLPVSDSTKAHRLTGLKQLTNVNAIKPDQELVIGPRLTIIYGDNGSGKSGYARVLKRATRARSVEPILRNVYDLNAPQEPASAIFVFHDGHDFKNTKWIDQSKSPDWLGRFAVFDSKCVPIYVGEKIENSLMPFGLDVLPKLTAVIEQLKQRFDSAFRAGLPNIEPLKSRISKRSSVYQLLSELKPDTRPEFVLKQSEFSEADDQQVRNLKTKYESMKLSTAQSVRAKLMEQRKYLHHLQSQTNKLKLALSHTELEGIEQGLKQLEAVNQASEFAKSTLSKSILSGAGGSAWKELLLAAIKYSETTAYPGKKFAAPGSHCVLCHQLLDSESSDRLQQFLSFVQSETEAKRNRIKRVQEDQLSKLGGLPLTMPDYEPSLRESIGDAGVSEINVFLLQCKELTESVIASLKDGNLRARIPLPQTPDCVARSIANIDAELAAISDEKGLAEVLDVVAKQIEELEAKSALKNDLALVLDYIKALQQQEKNRKASEACSTRAVTVKAKELQEKFVTEKFKSDFRKELEAMGLSCSLPNISEQSQKGKVFRKLSLSCAVGDVDSSAVFSEGERTGIAIALFLAEIGSENETSGVIFDDPVTSLDHRVRESITDRLVCLAGRRQVIIFTHDLVFFRALIVAAAREQVETHVQCVNRLGSRTGLITSRPPWNASSVKDRLRILRGYLQKAKAAEEQSNVEQYQTELRAFYERLRETWERAVEEVVLNGVIQRLEPPVGTQRLLAVTVDDDTVRAVFDGMGKTSEHLHDIACGVRSTSLDLKVAMNQLDSFETFLKAQRDKNDKTEAARGHLKGKFKC